MQVNFSKKFKKEYTKADRKIQSAFDRRLTVFLQNQLHPLLDNHPLVGSYIGYRSINVTGDWRAHYSEYETEIGERAIVFELLGTHSQLYG